MFSFFKKKHSEPATAPLGDSTSSNPAPAVDFDFAAQALYKGERCYQTEVLTGSEPVIYGLPSKKGRNS